METYVLSKALAAADHTYQSKLLRKCMHAIRKQGELRTKYEMVVKIKHVTLAVKALESIKKYAQMQIQAKEMNAKALQHYYQALQLRALKALCVFRSRESLVRQFRERSLIN